MYYPVDNSRFPCLIGAVDSFKLLSMDWTVGSSRNDSRVVGVDLLACPNERTSAAGKTDTPCGSFICAAMPRWPLCVKASSCCVKEGELCISIWLNASAIKPPTLDGFITMPCVPWFGCCIMPSPHADRSPYGSSIRSTSESSRSGEVAGGEPDWDEDASSTVVGMGRRGACATSEVSVLSCAAASGTGCSVAAWWGDSAWVGPEPQSAIQWP